REESDDGQEVRCPPTGSAAVAGPLRRQLAGAAGRRRPAPATGDPAAAGRDVLIADPEGREPVGGARAVAAVQAPRVRRRPRAGAPGVRRLTASVALRLAEPDRQGNRPEVPVLARRGRAPRAAPADPAA